MNRSIAIYRFEFPNLYDHTFYSEIEMICRTASVQNSIQVQSFTGLRPKEPLSLEPFLIFDVKSFLTIVPEFLKDNEYYFVLSNYKDTEFPYSTMNSKSNTMWHRELDTTKTNIEMDLDYIVMDLGEAVIKPIMYKNTDPEYEKFWSGIWSLLTTTMYSV